MQRNLRVFEDPTRATRGEQRRLFSQVGLR